MTGPEFVPNQIPVEFIKQPPSDLYIFNCINNSQRPDWDPTDSNQKDFVEVEKEKIREQLKSLFASKVVVQKPEE